MMIVAMTMVMVLIVTTVETQMEGVYAGNDTTCTPIGGSALEQNSYGNDGDDDDDGDHDDAQDDDIHRMHLCHANSIADLCLSPTKTHWPSE